MANSKYLVVYKAFESVVPRSLRGFVQHKITDELAPFGLDLDFTGKRTPRDLLVTFSGENPGWPAYGESARIRVNGIAGSGDSTIWVGAMKTMRLATSPQACEPAFPETEDSLGTLIANTTIHETAHMLGLDTGGFDDGGHSSDTDNYMWDAGTMPGGDTHVSRVFEYIVKTGDTLNAIVQRYITGTLDKCRSGSNDLTVMQVWQHPKNKEMGFVAHPKKSGVPGRRANDPHWIYTGEKVALSNNNLRTQEYRHKIVGFLHEKTFTAEQIETMKKFVAERLAAGKG